MEKLIFQGIISNISLASSEEGEATTATFKFLTIMRTPSQFATLGELGKLTGHPVKLKITNDQLELALDDGHEPEVEGTFTNS